MTNSLKILYSRPGMYISPHEQKIDAAGFITGFLDAILEPREITCPDDIHITVSGRYISMEARNCWIDKKLPEFSTFLSILNPCNFRKVAFEDGYVVGIMRSIIWFSEYCLANITIQDKMFQQAFWRSLPFSEQPKTYLDSEPPKISFFITLPAEVFEDRMLEIERLRRVIEIWEKRRCEHAPTEIVTRLHKFDKYWVEQSKYHFSLRFSISSFKE